MKYDSISINKEIIPYTFDILLADALFNFRIDYNKTANIFTVTLSKDNKVICVEPLIYGKKLFQDVFQPILYPALDIIPLDESGQELTITFDNLSKTVMLVVDNGGDDFE